MNSDKKFCSICKTFLPYNHFSKDRKRKGGYCYECSECRKKRNGVFPKGPHTKIKICKDCLKALSLNYDNFFKKLKGFSNKCKECTKIDNKNNYDKNQRKYCDQKKLYFQYNKEKIKSYKQKRKGYLQKSVNKYKQKRKEYDKLFKMRLNISERIRRCYEREGFQKQLKTQEILGCDYATLHTHLVKTFEDNYRVSYKPEYYFCLHIDHVTPLSVAKNEKDLYKLNHYTNLQLLYKKDNLNKGNKINWNLDLTQTEFYKEVGIEPPLKITENEIG